MMNWFKLRLDWKAVVLLTLVYSMIQLPKSQAHTILAVCLVSTGHVQSEKEQLGGNGEVQDEIQSEGKGGQKKKVPAGVKTTLIIFQGALSHHTASSYTVSWCIRFHGCSEKCFFSHGNPYICIMLEWIYSDLAWRTRQKYKLGCFLRA